MMQAKYNKRRTAVSVEHKAEEALSLEGLLFLPNTEGSLQPPAMVQCYPEGGIMQCMHQNEPNLRIWYPKASKLLNLVILPLKILPKEIFDQVPKYIFFSWHHNNKNLETTKGSNDRVML